MKFQYSTRLNPRLKNDNRISLISENTMLAKINGKRTYFNIDVNTLPFTEAVRKAYKAVSEESELEYFDIGDRPEMDFELDASDLLHINYMMFLYVMRRAQARHVWNKSQPNYFTSYVREDIMSSMFIHRLKLVTLQALTNGWSPRTHAREIVELYRKEGFPEGTYRLYLLYWDSGEACQTVKGLCDTNEPFVLDFEALLEEADLIITESNLESLANHQAGRRLRFLADSNRYQPSDFAAELLSRSRVAYIHCRPFLSRQHSINYARAVISTYALRMVQHYQSPERARMLTSPEGVHSNRFEAIDESYAADGNVEDQLIALIDDRRELTGDYRR